MSKTVLVTGIGGNVGYGILRNIRHNYADIKIVGVNTERVSPGNYLCDFVYEVPFSNDKNYIPLIESICKSRSVELIIPSTDYETVILSKNILSLPVVAVSPAETSKIFLDKYISYLTLAKHKLAFAESILPSDYTNQFENYIIKPREGRGSRNIFINPVNPQEFSNEYIIQPLLNGSEITTAFYITKQNDLHGIITLVRELAAGATQTCEVCSVYDDIQKEYILQLISKIVIRGSCNLQCIVTENGIVPFEVNCRISGTNSIRSQFGFKDVCYTVDEYLYGKNPEKADITKGAAVRILCDIIYPGISLSDINNNSDHFYVYE